MGDIVLVHGAWQGAWCWERVVGAIEAAGHRVHTPTLTGSGERAAELTPDVTLEDHVEDVARVLLDGDLDDVVLVGHSYAGMVITGVAERLSDRIAALVFVDGFYPFHGESALDQMPPPFQQLFRRRALEEGDGWRLPAGDALLDVWGLANEADRAWVGPRLTDWSLNLFTSPADVPQMRRSALPRVYFSAAAEDYPAGAAFRPIAEKARRDGCDVTTFPTGHDIMVEAPREFADTLLARASA